MVVGRRFAASLIALALLLVPMPVFAARAAVLYELKLPGGASAVVFSDGSAQVFAGDHRRVAIRRIQPGPTYDHRRNAGAFADRQRILTQLSKPPAQLFAPNRVIVVYRAGETPNGVSANRALVSLGVDRSEPLFRRFNAYRLHFSRASVPQAVRALAKLSSVAYVSPDWIVTPMHTAAIPLQRDAATQAAHRDVDKTNLPSNYALVASAQSLLDTPSVDLPAAWSEVESRFEQLPGTGETITNVSLGDLDDSGALNNENDPCGSYVSAYGPTTVVIGGQRYLDLPSMPLIPTYTADTNGNLNGDGEVCGVDAYLTEIGLDFSVMAPLPHDQQRPGEIGSGYSDLLGIAPGANYRLVVPASAQGTISDIDAALLAAADQTPKPDVITASLGFGYDQYGFPSRYLEEDPLTEQIIASIVKQNIVVCIASGDGTRTFTKVAIGPSGGSVPTELATSSATALSDDYLSTIPSHVYDSGSVDVGGTTLDDIFAAPPQYATRSAAIAAHAYPETRWTGFTLFSSGFGPRVNVSAPSDNVLSFEHHPQGAADSVDVVLEGGTSAAAPETAAAAAIALQVARLTGHPFTSAQAVRTFLEETATSIPAVPQADTSLDVGPQIDVRAIVERLLENAGVHLPPSVAGVAVAQRRDYADLDSSFVTDTDRNDIDLQGPSGSGANQLAWITIAPNWMFLPANATYRLFVKGHLKQGLAQTPWARLLPSTIFAAAGLPATSSSARSIKLTYEARSASKVILRSEIPLTFSPNAATQAAALAPNVPPLITGSTIPVSYDLSNVSSLNAPKLVVSEPGRFNPVTGQLFHPAYTVALTQPKGTLTVPVSALQGSGVYGIGIELDSTNEVYSDFSIVRVTAGVPSSVRPAAPLLSAGGSPPGHLLQIPYGGSFQVHYDVSDVQGATGATLEISAAGPTIWQILNPFNNPNGSTIDHNGVDSGSIYRESLFGASGMVTIPAVQAGLLPAFNEVVRVIPTRFGETMGEGSDVSTVTMNGVLASDGGSISNGWGIDQHGSDGFITSTQQTASGQTSSSLETFTQSTNAIVTRVATQSNGVYFTNGWGVYAGDVGLFGAEDLASHALSYHVLNTVSSATIGTQWTPPILSTFNINGWLQDAANDGTSGIAAFLAYDGSEYSVFTSNPAQNTFSSAYNVMGPLSLFRQPLFFGIAQNSSANTAIGAAYDLDDGTCGGSPTLVNVDLASGNVGSIPGIGLGQPNSIAIDSATNTAAVPTNCDSGLGIYNLTSGGTKEVVLPLQSDGVGYGFYTAADPVHHLFLVMQPSAPDDLVNNNSLSRVLVYDENGNLEEAIPRFCVCQTFIFGIDDQLQINPGTRTAYTVDRDLQQLIPFTY